MDSLINDSEKFELQAHASSNHSMEPVITGAAISLPANEATTCEFLKASFRYTAPIITDTGEKPLLLESGLLKYHHLSVA